MRKSTGLRWAALWVVTPWIAGKAVATNGANAKNAADVAESVDLGDGIWLKSVNGWSDRA